jgi:hypothetical protein
VAKAKGSTFSGLTEFLRRQGEAGRRAVRPDLHRYLDEEVVLSSWYPEEDLLDLIRAMVHLLPPPASRVLEGAGRTSARLHAEGVYSRLIRQSGEDPVAFARRSFALWASQHDTGRLILEPEGEGARVRLVDYALPSREMCTIVGSYIAEVLRISGIAKVRIQKLACRLDGRDECAWHCAWERKA